MQAAGHALWRRSRSPRGRTRRSSRAISSDVWPCGSSGAIASRLAVRARCTRPPRREVSISPRELRPVAARVQSTAPSRVGRSRMTRQSSVTQRRKSRFASDTRRYEVSGRHRCANKVPVASRDSLFGTTRFPFRVRTTTPCRRAAAFAPPRTLGAIGMRPRWTSEARIRAIPRRIGYVSRVVTATRSRSYFDGRRGARDT